MKVQVDGLDVHFPYERAFVGAPGPTPRPGPAPAPTMSPPPPPEGGPSGG